MQVGPCTALAWGFSHELGPPTAVTGGQEPLSWEQAQCSQAASWPPPGHPGVSPADAGACWISISCTK